MHDPQSDRRAVFQEREFRQRMIVAGVLFALFLLLVNTWRFSTGIVQPDPDYAGTPLEPAAAEQNGITQLSPAALTPLLPEEEAASSAISPAIAIPAEWLAGVQDNTLGVRKDEADHFFRILARARDLPAADLERAARRDVQHINLMSETERYRGAVVTVTGEMWRLSELPATENRYQVRRLYEAWIFTDDSGSHPYRVVCTSVPKGMPLGQNLRAPVQLTGYFFKREAYDTPEGVHVAPTILAQRLQWYQPPNAPPPLQDLAPYLMGVVGAVSLALIVTLVAYALSDQQAVRADIRRLQQGGDVRLPDFRHIELVPLQDTLQQLSVPVVKRTRTSSAAVATDELAPPALHILARPAADDEV